MLKGFTVPYGYTLTIDKGDGEVVTKEPGEQSGGTYTWEQVMSGQIEGWQLSTQNAHPPSAPLNREREEEQDYSKKEKETKLEGAKEDIKTNVRAIKMHPRIQQMLGAVAVLNSSNDLTMGEWKNTMGRAGSIYGLIALFEDAERTISLSPPKNVKSPHATLPTSDSDTAISKEYLKTIGVTTIAEAVDYFLVRPFANRTASYTPERQPEPPLGIAERDEFKRQIDQANNNPTQENYSKLLNKANSPERLAMLCEFVGSAQIKNPGISFPRNFSNELTINTENLGEIEGRVRDALNKLCDPEFIADKQTRREVSHALNQFVHSVSPEHNGSSHRLDKDNNIFLFYLMKSIKKPGVTQQVEHLRETLDSILPMGYDDGSSVGSIGELVETIHYTARDCNTRALRNFRDAFRAKYHRYDDKQLLESLSITNSDGDPVTSVPERLAAPINFALSLAHPVVAKKILETFQVVLDKKNDRAYARPAGNDIVVNPDTVSTATVAHEVAHLVEARMGIVNTMKYTLPMVFKRTAGGGEQQLPRHKEEDETEWYRDSKDRKFIDNYVTKVYEDRTLTEVISMGIQYLWNNPAAFALLDREHFLTTLRVMAPEGIKKHEI